MDVSKYYDTSKPITQSSADILKVYINDLDKLTDAKEPGYYLLEISPLPKG
jgi:hypothetical protein